jgi:hypothetical protein
VLFGQTTVQTYILEDVWFEALRPNFEVEQMTGTFEWTYDAGDFENGSGVFTEVSIPYYGSAISTMNITIETSSIEFSFNGNQHGFGLDLTLFLLEPLSPDQPAVIDTVRSRYQIENGTVLEGAIISGSITPVMGPCIADVNGDGMLNFLDVSMFLSAFGSQDPVADFNTDGMFNFLDVSQFLSMFGAGCP